MIYVLIKSVDAFFLVLYAMLLARIILSWFPMNRNNPLMRFLFAFTEPVLAPVRNLVQRSPLGGPGMVLDFSPLIVIVLLRLTNGIVSSMLYGLL